MAVETLADAAVVVRPDFSKAQSETKSGAKAMGENAGQTAGKSFIDKFGDSVNKGGGKIRAVMSTLASTFIVGHFVGNMLKFGVQAAASLEQARVGFTTLLGSAKAAGTYLTQLQKFAAATPFELAGLIDSSRTLLGVGVAAKQVIPLLTAFGDAAGAVGVDQAAFQRIILATSQAISAGKFQIQDLNQIMTNGIPVYTILSQALGKPVPELRKLATAGKLLSKDVLPALEKQMEKDYGGAMAKQSQTLAGVWSTLKDSVAIGLSNALTPLIPIMSNLIPRAANVLSSIFVKVTALVVSFANGFKDGESNLTGFAGIAGTVGAKIGAVLSVFDGGKAKINEATEPYAKLGEVIRNEVIPAHIELAQDIASEVIPKVAGLVVAVATTMIPIMYKLEEVFKGQIVPALETVTEFLDKHETAVRDVAVAIGALIAVNKAMEVVEGSVKLAVTGYNTAVKLAEGVTKIFTGTVWLSNAPLNAQNAVLARNTALQAENAVGVKAVTTSLLAESIVAEGSTAKLFAQAIATKAVTEANVLFARGMLVVDAVMDANPFTLIVLALIAVGVAFYELWTRSETFRKIVEATWNGIKAAALAVASWFMGTFVASFVRAYDQLKSGLGAVGSFFSSAWDNIKSVTSAVVGWVNTNFVQPMVALFNGIAAVVVWLYEKIWAPQFHAIQRVAQAVGAIIQLAFAIYVSYIKNVVAPAIMWLYEKAFKPAFGFISAVVSTDIAIVKNTLAAVIGFITGIVSADLKLFQTVVGAVFHFVAAVVSADIAIVRGVLNTIYSYIKGPLTSIHNAFQHTSSAVWGNIANGVSAAWNKIHPWLTAFNNFMTKTLPGGFQTAVSAIGKAWTKIEAVAKTPITFTVNHVINPLINGFNKVAKAFGTSQIPPIAGFAEGGQIPGAPSSSDNRLAWLKGPQGQPLGTVGVATGEFVVNADDTRKALPLLRWINDGMRGGLQEVGRYLGRPLTQFPGDGSEGWAFAKGGLVGFLDDVWGAISSPAKLIKAPIEAALKGIPGSGVVKDLLVGMGHKLVNGLTSWISGSSTGAMGGKVGAAQAFVRAQNNKPYIWADAGPDGYDCSGIVSAVYNVLKGKDPYSHTFSTESLPDGFFHEGARSGPLIAGWSHPGEAPASASVGHMAGNIGGLAFESSGSRGVHLGPSARQVGQFAHIGAAYSRGGLVELAQIAKADFGSVTLAKGHNLVYNGTGKPEPLVSPGGGGDVHFHFHGPVSSKNAAKDLVYAAYLELQRDRKIPKVGR